MPSIKPDLVGSTQLSSATKPARGKSRSRQTNQNHDDEFMCLLEEQPLYQELDKKHVPDEANHLSYVTYKNEHSKMNPGRQSRSLDGTIQSAHHGMTVCWSDMTRVKSSGILQKLTNEERAVKEILFEIILSQGSYMKSMDLLVKHFVRCVELMSVLPEESYTEMFNGAENMQVVGERFMSMLHDLWLRDCDLDPSLFARLVLKFVKGNFDKYTEYIGKTTFRMKWLEDEKKNNKPFAAVLGRLLIIHRSLNSWDLRTFFGLPFQRLTDLAAQLKQLMEYTSRGKPHYKDLECCVKYIDECLNKSCEADREYYSQVTLKGLQNDVSLNTIKESFAFAIPGRIILKHGKMRCLGKLYSGKLDENTEVTLYLCSDVVFFTYKNRLGQLKVQDHEIASRVSVEKASPILFCLKFETEDFEYMMECETEDDLKDWVKAFSKLQEDKKLSSTRVS